jgi:acetyltransferase-like isoleucine patch superfamily enzyme
VIVRIRVRSVLKSMLQGAAVTASFPLALLCAFGRFSQAFQAFAQFLAVVPGLLGDYLRVAYYYLTLRECSLHSRISFGSFFAQSSSSLGPGVYIGAYCVLGACRIGERTQIASHVQIASGRHQHARAVNGRILGANEDQFKPVLIGPDCWIGASAIILADVGAKTTVGAGAVVTRPVPESVVVVGNPARPLEPKNAI